MMIVLVFLAIFFVTMFCVSLGLAFHESRRRKQFAQMLRTVEAGTRSPEAELLRAPDEAGAAESWFKGIRLVASLDRTIRQSGSGSSVGKVLAMSLGGCFLGALVGSRLSLLSMPMVSAACFSFAGAVIPLWMVVRKRKKYISEFEGQFPDALDFMARSLRAGHGFSTSLELLASEAPDPLGAVFRRVANELQLGSALDAAMNNLSEAIPLVDVRFFISAVVIQRETGGNLGEILMRLAVIIRERFRLRGSVKALSAHGRITGLVLLLMPIAVLIILSVISPEYFAKLTQDSTGKKLLGAAAGGQVLAYLCIKKIVNIKV